MDPFNVVCMCASHNYFQKKLINKSRVGTIVDRKKVLKQAGIYYSPYSYSRSVTTCCHHRYYNHKRFAATKQQKTIDASAKVSHHMMSHDVT